MKKQIKIDYQGRIDYLKVIKKEVKLHIYAGEKV